jgi:DNA-binding IclR family transcriptional regulator
MSYPIPVLQSLLRLSRRKKSPSLQMLVDATGMDEAMVRRSLFTLASSGLVQRTPAGLHLTLAGLAVAVALPPYRARRGARPLASARSITTRARARRAA